MLNNKYLILHNIRSVYNTGAIFRTADACGIDKIYITGYTPTPFDRFGRERKDFNKSALGAQKSVPWQHFKSPGSLITRLKKDGFKLVAIEQNERSVDYKKVKLKKDERIVFILGNEVKGISKAILDKSDVIAEIKMMGQKESLNVSVTAGIVLFRILNI